MPVISKAKLEDIEWRNKTLEVMLVALRQYAKTKDREWLRYMQSLGQASGVFKERIERGDYTERDTEIGKVEEILKRNTR